MKNKKYLLEIITEDLPCSEINHATYILKKNFIKTLNNLNIFILKLNLFISYKRIILFLKLKCDVNFDLRPIVKKIFNTTKFKTNMRWSCNKNTFLRPIISYIIMCNNKLLNHYLFKIKSNNKTIIFTGIKKKHLIINMKNYKKILIKNNVLYSFNMRKNFLLNKINIFLKKINCNIILNNFFFNNLANTFEMFKLSFLKVDLSEIILPQKIIVLITLNNNYIPIIKDNNIYGFLLISSIINHNIKTTHIINIKNKLLDFNKMRLIDLMQIKKNITSNIYIKLKRLYYLKKYLCDKLNCLNKYIFKCIIFITIELSSKVISELSIANGLLFINYKNNYLDKLFYDYNKLYLNKFPNNLSGVIITITMILDNIINLYLNQKIPKGKKDPYNFKKTVILFIKNIIINKINLNLLELIKKSFTSFKIYNNNDILFLYIYLIEKLKFNFKCKYFDIIKNKENILNIYTLSKILNNFFKYIFKNDLLIIIKRIDNILKKHLKIIVKFQKKFINNFYEKILFNKLKKNILIINILIKNKLYFELNKFYLTFAKHINNFFSYVFILDKNINIKNNRLKLLNIIKFILNKKFKFNIENIENKLNL